MTRIELAADGRLRRRVIAGIASTGALALTPARLIAAPVGSSAELGFTELPDGALAEQSLQVLPGKVPLIRKTARPPNFETPIEYFRTPITRNDAFFVRWHLSSIPELDAASWVLTVGGESATARAALHAGAAAKRIRARSRHGRVPMLRQPARIVRAARPGRAMGRRCDGQRRLAWRASQGCPRARGAQGGRGRGRLRRRGSRRA